MFRIAEVFGPTIQGEGPYAGAPCAFIRFGGCDYRCYWCDSMHAVNPELVRLLPQMTSEEILDRVHDLETSGKFEHVILSGGNPLVWDLEPLVGKLAETKFIHVETQGTIFKPWIELCDVVTVSPKPPSSKMKTVEKVLQHFIEKTRETKAEIVLKIVVFDLDDYRFAINTANRLDTEVLYLSVGTLPSDSTEDLLARYREIIALDQEWRQQWHHFPDVRILPQMHVLLWGHKLGV